MKFTHLHVHSHYSLLDGLSKIDDLLDKTKKLGMDSIALTDHGVMYGLIEFYKKALARNIKPILGIEAYLARKNYKEKIGREENYYHLTLLAKNKEGYENLVKLTTKAHLQGFYYKPRIDKKLLANHSNGLIALSGCIGGELSQAILNKQDAEKTALEYKNIFGNDYYIELMDLPNLPDTRTPLNKLAKKLNISTVATTDSHYLEKEDKDAQDILLCVQTNRKVQEKNRMSMLDGDYSLRSPKQMIKSFKKYPEAIENTQKIAELCNINFKLKEFQFPDFRVPTGYTPDSYLTKLSQQGLRKKYPKATKKIKERFNYELGIIKDMGFASYMLIVQDLVSWSRKRGITNNTRGSAAGSLVSYLLNIIEIDPLKYGLLFERFLNPGRNEMPDIDLDFADHRRDEIIEYTRNKYGSGHVAQIITFGTMAARAAIRDVGRALDLPYSFCDQTAKLIPMFTNLDDALQSVSEFKKLYNTNNDAKKLINLAQKLEGVVRHASTHACGVVISKDKLDKSVPVQRTSHKDETIVTQYEMHSIEDLGLLKMDFLGLKNLTVIEKTLEKLPKKIDWKKISLSDAKTIKLFQEGRTTAVFQFESSGMKRYLKALQPNSINDLIAMVALYRPGPMELIPDFIARKHGRKKIEYLHPKLEPILKDTYGIAVYQEQVLEMARDLAGFSLSEADILRKAVGKKIKELLVKQKEKFISGCIKNKISPSVAKKLFSFLEPFARYGFNRAHSTSYATIGYRTAYLKANYPAEFMASLLTADHGRTERITIEVDECKKMGIDILPPDINESQSDFTVINKKQIRFGLNAIKNVGEHIVKIMVKNTPYKSLEDFLEKVKDKDLNKKSLESLIKCGALDRFAERGRLLSNRDRLLSFSSEIQKTKASGQESLFGGDDMKIKLKLDDAQEADKKDCLLWEKELLGMYISEHPLEQHRDYLEYHATSISELSNAFKGQSVRIGGLISRVKKIITKNNQSMIFAELEDLTGKIEVIIFPRILEANSQLWEENKILLIDGVLNNRDGELKFVCQEARELV